MLRKLLSVPLLPPKALLGALLGALLYLQSVEWVAAQTSAPETIWLKSSEVNESSGLARSRRDDALWWTHNDSGDKPRLFAFDTTGQLHAEVEIKQAKSVDWEDMCSFQLDGQAWLAVADVGDNLFLRSHVTIYCMKEPKVPRAAVSPKDEKSRPQKLSTKVDFELKVTYPGGALNCEAIAYDPWQKQFLLISKEQLRGQVFAVPFDLRSDHQTVTAQPLFTLPVLLATGACISDDGTLLAIGSYGPTYLLRRSAAVDPAQAKWKYTQDSDLQLIPAPPRKQGESICFDASGTHLYMTSEGEPMPLMKTKLPDAHRPRAAQP